MWMNDSNPKEAGDSCEARSSGGNWRKSSFSASNGDCVEVAILAGGQVGVRDSKAIAGPHLRYSSHAWTAFVGDVRRARTTVGREATS